MAAHADLTSFLKPVLEKALSKKASDSAPLRILEIGAGSGGSTACISITLLLFINFITDQL